VKFSRNREERDERRSIRSWPVFRSDLDLFLVHGTKTEELCYTYKGGTRRRDPSDCTRQALLAEIKWNGEGGGGGRRGKFSGGSASSSPPRSKPTCQLPRHGAIIGSNESCDVQASPKPWRSFQRPNSLLIIEHRSENVLLSTFVPFGRKKISDSENGHKEGIRHQHSNTEQQ